MERKEKIKKREIRKKRKREKKMGTKVRPRLSLYKSRKHIYCQLIDDQEHKTLLSASDFELKKEEKMKRTKLAFLLGLLIAQKAKERGIKKIVFDKSGYKYHGILLQLAKGAREGGLVF
ncbi:MAG: 50S ribosomal protein L18 [Minisyncoccales bacterium]